MSIDLSQPITFDEALVAFTEEMPFLTESDVKGFFAASNDERALIVQTYKDAGKIPSADLAIFPGAGHGLMYQCPDRFGERVLVFLQK